MSAAVSAAAPGAVSASPLQPHHLACCPAALLPATVSVSPLQPHHLACCPAALLPATVSASPLQPHHLGLEAHPYGAVLLEREAQIGHHL